jgi:23S rRNA G2445 N2-methylase RlmL
VRRFAQAPVHRFVAVVAPEFSELCRKELLSMDVGEPVASAAGVDFTGRLDVCYRANLTLRTAARILCRLPAFRAGVPAELLERVRAFPWEVWIHPTIPLKIKSHVERSRIAHEGLVAEIVTKGIRQCLQLRGTTPSSPDSPAGSCQPVLARGQGPRETTRVARHPPAAFPALGEGLGAAGSVAGQGYLESRPLTGRQVEGLQRLWVRLVHNHCEISLDTTGAHLHRRGYRRHHTGAPLRETIAAALLLRCGWAGEMPLVDGMCGSGTLAIEGAFIARRLPPGLARPFLFWHWPSFRPGTWAHLRRMAAEMSRPRADFPIVGIDRDISSLGVARDNAEKAGVSPDIRWVGADFFTFRPENEALPPGLLVLNPPYGRRLHANGNLAAFYEELGKHLQRCFAGWRVAVAVPSRDLTAALSLMPAEHWQIRHGGLRLTFVLARIL